MSQERRPVYENPLVHLPKPHPAVWKIQDTQALFVVAVADGQYIITAAEIAECIKIDQLLRKAQKPKRSTLTYDVFTTTFNENNTVDNRRFAYIDDSTNAIITTGDAISFTDFGITKQHTPACRVAATISPQRGASGSTTSSGSTLSAIHPRLPLPLLLLRPTLSYRHPLLCLRLLPKWRSQPLSPTQSRTLTDLSSVLASRHWIQEEGWQAEGCCCRHEDEAEPAAGPSASGMNIDA
ncbi:hypothetical protein BKA70DRAFT_1568078 [Coprinopsis sp. MPI-PUGE-AT-0042]|nr:hypothetical protein BKA70DRAFT_1568078 [Coprinopsis sp. MPI-PUGE-AT-0042]